MNCVEIITLRSLRKDDWQLVDELLRQVFKHNESRLPESIRVYRQPNTETDLSIHIHWEVESQKPGESPLSQQLCRALKERGLLAHSIWIEKYRQDAVEVSPAGISDI